jgi:hypothetical protein
MTTTMEMNSLHPRPSADSERTAAQSFNPSVGDKKDPAESNMPSTSNSLRGEPQGFENPSKGDAVVTGHASEGSTSGEEEFEYPKAWSLAAITLALCLSVFCMALVRSYASSVEKT